MYESFNRISLIMNETLYAIILWIENNTINCQPTALGGAAVVVVLQNQSDLGLYLRLFIIIVGWLVLEALITSSKCNGWLKSIY